MTVGLTLAVLLIVFAMFSTLMGIGMALYDGLVWLLLRLDLAVEDTEEDRWTI